MLEKIKELIRQIKIVYEWASKHFWLLPVWKRALLTSLIGGIGGSSIVSLCNKYALYYHAIDEGFRVPIESVEYISLAVTLLSFLLIITSIIGTIAIYTILKNINDIISDIFFSKNEENAKKFKFFLLIPQLVFLGGLIVKLINKHFLDNIEIDFTKISTKFIYGALGIIVFVVLGLLFAKEEEGRKTFTLVIVLAGAVFVTSSLFNANVYNTFLSSIKYGGQIPIEVCYRLGDNVPSKVKGLLLIKSNNGIIIRDSLRDVIEIPIDRISKVTYIENKTNLKEIVHNKKTDSLLTNEVKLVPHEE